MLPEWLFRFPTVGEVQSRPTRQSNHLVIGRTNIDLGSRAISIRGPKEWNNLPTDLRSSPSIQVFKNNLKKHILGRNFMRSVI